MGSDRQADYVGELRERAERAEGALKVAAAHNHELQEENDWLKGRIAELEKALRQILINREEDEGGPCVEGMNGRPCDCSQCVALRAIGDLRRAARLVEGKEAG